MPDISLNEGLYRIGGMYGNVMRDGKVLAEVTEITATVEINRIEIPLVGSTRQGYKPGRESREGTFRVQKIDTYWELEVYKFFSQSLADRRAKRGTAEGAQRPFQLQINLDDPDSLGLESWQLNGCLLWRMPIGFSITDDLIDREFPFTWETETPLSAYHMDRQGKNDATGFPAVVYDYKPNPASATG